VAEALDKLFRIQAPTFGALRKKLEAYWCEVTDGVYGDQCAAEKTLPSGKGIWNTSFRRKANGGVGEVSGGRLSAGL
jgi:hypothetical protein